MLHKHSLLQSSIQRLDDSVAASNAASGVPQVIDVDASSIAKSMLKGSPPGEGVSTNFKTLFQSIASLADAAKLDAQAKSIDRQQEREQAEALHQQQTEAQRQLQRERAEGERQLQRERAEAELKLLRERAEAERQLEQQRATAEQLKADRSFSYQREEKIRDSIDNLKMEKRKLAVTIVDYASKKNKTAVDMLQQQIDDINKEMENKEKRLKELLANKNKKKNNN